MSILVDFPPIKTSILLISPEEVNVLLKMEDFENGCCFVAESKVQEQSRLILSLEMGSTIGGE